MKALTLTLALLLTCATAAAATYQLPTIVQLTGHACNQETIAYQILGTDPDTGYTTGFVFGQTVCSAGGRGAGNSYDSGCYFVEWAGETLELSTEIWRRQSRISTPASECLGG